MSFQIAAVISPDDYVAPTGDPTPWEIDLIDHTELRTLQQEEFPRQWNRAKRCVDKTPFMFDNEVLYSLTKPFADAKAYPRLMLPRKYHEQVLCRARKETGHVSCKTVLRKVQASYIWPRMRAVARLYLVKGVLCPTTVPRGPADRRRPMLIPPRPFHTWNLDLIGPFPKSPNGNRYLLTCVDHFTGWAEAIPIPTKANTSVWDALKSQVFCRFGPPSAITFGDSGESATIEGKMWLTRVGVVKYRLKSYYHPQSHGKTERFNRTVRKTLLEESRGTTLWESRLPAALYAYRVSADTDGITPFQRVYGQRPRDLKRSEL